MNRLNMTNFETLEQRLMMSATDPMAAMTEPDGFGDATVIDDSGASLDDARQIYLNSRGAGRLVGLMNYTQDIDLLRIDANQNGRMQATIEIDEANADLSCTLAIMSGSGAPVIVESDISGRTSVLRFQVTKGESYYVCIFGDGQNEGKYTVNVATLERINTEPVAANDAAVIDEDQNMLNLDVLANDTDDDGDSLSLVSYSQAENGSVVLNADGTFSYIPESDFNGSDSFSYVISDGNGGESTATVNITVNAVNDAPVADDDTAVVSEDSSVVISPLSGDSDADADVLSIISADGAANGAVVINDDGTITYTPNADFNGTDSFDYVISDGNGGQASATVNITVEAVNDSPVAVDDSVTVDEDSSVVISPLAGDSDLDGDELSIVSASGATNGVIVVNDDGTITYTPNADFYGTDSFSYVISDGIAEATANVSIDVHSINDAPVITGESAELEENTSVILSVLANDTDTEGDSLSVISVSDAANGEVVINIDGTITYTPDADFFGTDSFSYTVSDGNGGEVSATVSLTVTEAAPTEPVSGSVVTASVVEGDNGLTLVICGTDGDDTIVIDQLESGIMLYAGADGEFIEGDFAAVAIYGFDGSDWLRATATVSIASFIYGGSGNDQIYNNSLGQATIDAGSGDDLIVSIGGVADDITGGEGLDSFWNDSIDVLGDVSADEIAASTVHNVDEFHQPYTSDTSSSQYISKVIDGQNFSDPAITSAASKYTSFIDSPLFYDGADYDDIRQGQVGDCYYLASLAAFADQSDTVIEQAITSLGDGTYAVRFFQYDGSEVTIRIDADLPTNSSGSLVYAKSSDGGEIWVPLMEKAYAIFRYNGNNYSSLASGWTSIVFQELTGKEAQIDWTGSNSASDLYSTISSSLDAGKAVTMISNYSDMGSIVGSHAYSAVDAYELDGVQYVVVYNPWGFDGRGGDSDGLITLTAAQLKSYFQHVTLEV